MSEKYDYSKTVLSQGLVCYNTNNNNYCVVIDGNKGSEDDRCSMVMEFTGERGFMIHTPPNRALIPTGRVVNLKPLANAMRINVVMEDF